MRHYEIVLVIKPNFDTQMRAIIDRYQSLITESGGTIHRYEEWGKRNLAYPIQNHTKGHYVLMNVEVESDVMLRINTLANTNETLLRYLVLQLDEAVTETSAMLQAAARAETERNARPARRTHSAVDTSTATSEETKENATATTQESNDDTEK